MPIQQIRFPLIVRSIICLLLLLCSNVLLSTHAFASSSQKLNSPNTGSHTITPQTSNEVLLNPGKGWVLYGSPSNQTAATMAYATVGYTRYNWDDIEPQEGVFNWSSIDTMMNAWHAAGKQLAFGIMNANSANPNVAYVTPNWVFTDGAHFVKSKTSDPILGTSSIQYIPVWNDPIFLRKVQDFVNALAQRYDGNPDIAYIDIRSYGNWGVQKVDDLPGSQALSDPDAEKHAQIYLNAFKKTQLILPWAMRADNSMYIWAVNNKIGLRRDGIMVDSNGSELTAAYGKAPEVFEFYSSYQWLVKNHHWNSQTLTNDVLLSKPNYVGMGQWRNDGQVMLAQNTSLVQSLANTMGYYFLLKSATLPNSIRANQTNTFSFTWRNNGVAYLLNSASVAIALLDTSNNVVQMKWLSGVNPQTWTPAQNITTNSTVQFSGVPVGTYKIAVGLFQHSTDSNPTYKIGNQGRTSNGWYVLNTIPVV